MMMISCNNVFVRHGGFTLAVQHDELQPKLNLVVQNKTFDSFSPVRALQEIVTQSR